MKPTGGTVGHFCARADDSPAHQASTTVLASSKTFVQGEGG